MCLVTMILISQGLSLHKCKFSKLLVSTNVLNKAWVQKILNYTKCKVMHATLALVNAKTVTKVM